ARHATRVVRRVGIVLSRVAGDVRERGQRGDPCRDGEESRAGGRKIADAPSAGGFVVGALRSRGRDEGESGRQLIGDHDAGGGARPVVGGGDGEGDLAADRRRDAAGRLADVDVGGGGGLGRQARLAGGAVPGGLGRAPV